jgi:hypothetical protein
MHFLKVNEKPTNALAIQRIGIQYSPTCFGTLKCHHQGVKYDPAEIGAQCLWKQRWMGAVYCNGRRVVGMPKHVGKYCVPIHWMINAVVGFLFAFHYILHTAINNSLFQNVTDKPVLVAFEDDPQRITSGDPSCRVPVCAGRITRVRSTTDRIHGSGPIIFGRFYPFYRPRRPLGRVEPYSNF